jgi:hypothetical protein
MSKMCSKCGYTEHRAVKDAKALGLEKELKGGFYTCCQIAQWADEQWLAWLQAAEEDCKRDQDVMQPESSDPQVVLVPVRLRKPRT